MSVKMWALILLLLLVAPTLHAADMRYLCVADKATGFSLDKTSEQWKISSFNVTNSKYIIRKAKDPEYKYEILIVG